MREHEVDVVLDERVERRSLRQHPTDLLVVALGVGLLLRVVGVAEEHPCAPLVFVTASSRAVLLLRRLQAWTRSESRFFGGVTGKIMI